ncbi:hypothetical protein ALC57_13373 [Trachymyrmex cornetzi]|uniref:Uncharacterized protein n=1 Tax=Trachymyrmex cornetzi TaxID=471704 RepID=A0A151IZD3_9HYME|nr:hypothetical protein ALC57_13373 [Trachymyrmex cornetzi]
MNHHYHRQHHTTTGITVAAAAAAALLPLPPPPKKLVESLGAGTKDCMREGGGHRERVVGRHSRGYTRLIYLWVDTKAQDGSLLPFAIAIFATWERIERSSIDCRSKLSFFMDNRRDDR